MTRFERALLCLLAATLLLGSWMLRFEMVMGKQVPYVLDRWTGNVRPVIPDFADPA